MLFNGLVIDMTNAMHPFCTGIGYAVAEGFAEAGASLVLVYAADRPEMKTMAAEMAERHNVTVMEHRCDVSDAKQVERMVSSIAK